MIKIVTVIFFFIIFQAVAGKNLTIEFKINSQDLIDNKVENIFEFTDEFGKKIISIFYLFFWQTTRASNSFGITFSVHPDFMQNVSENNYSYNNPFVDSTGNGLMVQDRDLYTYPLSTKQQVFLSKYDLVNNVFVNLNISPFSPYYTYSNDTILSGDRKNITSNIFPTLTENTPGVIQSYLLYKDYICLSVLVDAAHDLVTGTGFCAIKLYKLNTDRWSFLWASRLQDDDDFPYCIAYQSNAFVFCTNLGWIYSVSESGGIKNIKLNYKKISNQVYCALKVNGEMLYGHYPSGRIHSITDGQQIDTMEPPILNPVGSNERELMAMCLYAGSIYAGIWPWGEIYRKNINTSVWSQAMRCFSKPAFNQLIEAPYADTVRENGWTLDYNEFGQRVYQMLLFDEYLFMSTCGKDGYFRDSWNEAEGDSDIDLNEYGKIHSIRINGQYTFYLDPLNDFTTIKIEILNTSGNINFYINNILSKTLENCVVNIPDNYNFKFFNYSNPTNVSLSSD